jgi:hypothetical protein
VLAVLVVAAVIAGIGLIAVNASNAPGTPSASPDTTGTPSSSPSPTTVAPASRTSIGDPRTADPCSLIATGVLNAFGHTVIDHENSEFSACRADMTLSSGATVAYIVDFLSPPEVVSAAPEATYEQQGGLTIIREPGAPDVCERRVVFPDGNVVDLQAQLYDQGAADLCAIADAGTSFALDTITQQGIGTRTPLDATSTLAGVDACSLLTQSDLTTVHRGEATTAEAEFGHWGCIWRPATANTVRMDYYRGYQLDPASDGPLAVFAGKNGATWYEPGRYCLSQIVQRDFTPSDGIPRSDLVRIFVFGADPEDVLCTYATQLAGTVAPKLPAG